MCLRNAEVSFALYTAVMPPNSSRSKVSLKLTANNMFSSYANYFLSNTHTHTQTEELTGVDFRSAAEKESC